MPSVRFLLKIEGASKLEVQYTDLIILVSTYRQYNVEYKSNNYRKIGNACKCRLATIITGGIATANIQSTDRDTND